MSTNLKKALKPLAEIGTGINEYSDDASSRKQTLHTQGKVFLTTLAKELQIEPGTFEIRSNRAGIAVSGEVTLHSDKLYVQLLESCVGKGGVSVLYRNCAGRNDYTGGTNNFVDTVSLYRGALSGFVAKCKSLIDSAPQPQGWPRP